MIGLRNGGSVWILGATLLLAWPAVGRGQVSGPDGPLDVDEAVRIALRQNYAHRQASENVGVSKGQRLDAVASLLPSFGGSASYSKSDGSGTETSVLVDGEPDGSQFRTDAVSSNTSYGLSIREDLSLPLWYSYRSRNSAVRAAQHAKDASAQTLAFNVRQQFYLLLRAQDLLQVQEEDLRLARDQERRINSMFELGSVARVDVLKARVRVADAEVALIQQQNQVDIQRATLATYLGLSPTGDLTVAGELATVTPSVIDSLQAIRDSEARPDLLKARADYGAASNSYVAALTSRLPGIYAQFRIGKESGDRDFSGSTFIPGVGVVPYTGLRESDGDGWTFEVGATVSLDAFANMGRHSSSRAARRQAELAVEGLELSIKLEIEEAILNYRASVRAIDAAERGVESAEEDLRLSEERYRQGLGTVLELLEAQVNLTRARNARVNALTGLKISEAAYDKARGAPLPAL